ncbi:MAG: serine/threonine-protein phosphatase [Spirochaetales bacterium]|nr:serine/threonine-protein phosphatase [Spirochaetales bacterium]
MGLTIFTYLAVAIVVVLAFSVRGRGVSLALYRAAALASAAYAVLLASGYTLAAYNWEVATVLIRGAGVGAITAYLAFLRLGAAYPSARLVPVVDLLLVAAVVAVGWFMVGTDVYVVVVARVGVTYTRNDGSLHAILGAAGAGIGLVGAVVMAARSIGVKNRVHRQHLLVMAAGLGGSVAWGYVFAILGPSLGLGILYPLSAANILPSVLAAAYVFSSTRAFQPWSVARNLGYWLIVTVAFGVPLGLIVGVAFLFRESAAISVVVFAGLVFVVFARWAEAFARGRLGISRDEASREELESAIAHLDLSAGREVALAELDGIMKAALGCSWFSAISEDDEGSLVRVYPDDGTLVSPSSSPVMEALAAVEQRVVLRPDLETDERLAGYRAALTAFFDALGAEAIVLAKEGRRVVGIFAFGHKVSGAGYDALDYAMFDAVHGKLFVVAYYARHVARESLLATVEQELGLADQIIRSVQERIDPIQYPGVSVAYRCEAPRGLGGDLFDSVRISEHRWFFVVGDVSGKGLNASMSMIILKSMIRTLLREEKDFVRLVARANDFIKDNLPRGTFFAGLFGFLALDKGSVYFINCGLPAMFFRSPGLDSVIEAQGEGRMLGFVKRVEPYLKAKKLVLPPGSRVLISTDGIVEAESVRGERYGKERLMRVFTENKSSDAAETVDAVIRSATSFAGGKLDDDITVVVIDYDGQTREKQR